MASAWELPRDVSQGAECRFPYISSMAVKDGRPRRLKLVFLIRRLTIGGAERQLVELSTGLDRNIFDVTVLCFYRGGEFVEELAKANIPVISLNKKGRWDIFRFLWRLRAMLRKIQPDVIHSYMTGANLVATLLKPVLPPTRIVWGIESAYIDHANYSWLERVTSPLEIILSRLPELIVFNSFAGRELHQSAGFARSRAVVIHNGINTERFAPNRKSGLLLRESWRIPNGALLIGIVGRVNPIKDHTTFLRAAAIFARSRPEARFICIGGGPRKYADELQALGRQLGLTDRVIWPGFVGDMPAAYNALDLCCSSSYGEGTSNAIAEAMACAVPCVVTNVGDSAFIVGDTGIVVPPKDPEALAAGWTALLNLMTQNPLLGNAARARIESRLSLSALIRDTSQALLALL